jgi:hypothetical protein
MFDNDEINKKFKRFLMFAAHNPNILEKEFLEELIK